MSRSGWRQGECSGAAKTGAGKGWLAWLLAAGLVAAALMVAEFLK